MLDFSRQARHFPPAGAGLGGARAGRGQQLRRDNGSDEKGNQHEPVERLGHGKLVVRSLEPVVDRAKGEGRQRESQRAPSAHAAAEHDEQVDENDVGLLDVGAGMKQGHRGRGERGEPHDPQKDARSGGGDV